MNFTTHEEEYRSKELLDKIKGANIIVCGCGAIGSNLIDNLLRQGFEDITVIDFDRIEDHNRGTQIWESREVGSLKTESMKRRAFVVSKTDLKSVPKKLTKENTKKFLSTGKDITIVIDTFDNSDSRRLLYDFCKNNDKVLCLHAGLFQDYAEIIWNEAYNVPNDPTGPDVCEYPLARNIILLCVAVTSEVLIRYIDIGVMDNYMITLKDLRISLKDI